MQPLARGSSSTKAQEHVERLREVGNKFSIVDGAQCRKPGRAPLDLSDADWDVIREMAKTMLAEIEKRCEQSRLVPGWKTKRCTLTVEDLMDKIDA